MEKLKSLAKFNSNLGLLQKLMGIDFSRTFEYANVLDEIDFTVSKKILDIGTWRSPLPLFLAYLGFRVTVSDISLSKLKMQSRLAKKIETKNKINIQFNSVLSDATKLSIRDNSYDYVLCISTIEHIAGKTGDIKAIREMARIVRPGGKIILTVPYSLYYREGSWGPFFSRYYDKNAILNRIVRPSGLKLHKLKYLIGGDTKRVAEFIYFKLPRYLRHFFGWAQHKIALRYLDVDKAHSKDAFVAMVVLKK